MLNQISQLPPGSDARVRVVRGGKELDVQVAVANARRHVFAKRQLLCQSAPQSARQLVAHLACLHHRGRLASASGKAVVEIGAR